MLAEEVDRSGPEPEEEESTEWLRQLVPSWTHATCRRLQSSRFHHQTEPLLALMVDLQTQLRAMRDTEGQTLLGFSVDRLWEIHAPHKPVRYVCCPRFATERCLLVFSRDQNEDQDEEETKNQKLEVLFPAEPFAQSTLLLAPEVEALRVLPATVPASVTEYSLARLLLHLYTGIPDPQPHHVATALVPQSKLRFMLERTLCHGMPLLWF